MIHTHHIELAIKYLTGEQLEYYYAAYLNMEAINKNYEKELVTLFEQFKKAYPHSEYTHFIESEIIPIITFHRKQDESFSENTHIVDDAENINSLREAVRKINSKRVYVDIWATWCSPCKREFHFNNKLYDLLKRENTTMLYISIDEDDKAEKWMEMMKYYELGGYHIRANDSLMADLRRLRGTDSFGIPWHILTDGNGSIIKKYVSGPSDIGTLERQLNK
ncbi:TlpA family protein disulfide reductase [Gelidibacter japonicus]|uniref:TlpA family protein disulfide reductase n=1 Tax=Gelidibacter japonicus TaxID=1962232 RepID=UPI001F0825AC|nr:TlpA disulfide reductase family protein [Gelidibacter japonicus]